MRARHILIAFVFGAVGLATYAGGMITCPYCHSSDANVKGNCVLIQSTGQCSEDYGLTHDNLSTCPWCESRGTMSRFVAWLD